ncbi:uncharacterized protein CC84DRAFT_1164787 [Paraphaeosphaeria sporulosa]|uniref:DUF7726 domain-containing protein n=1 Tax=Paraphaeosphaeria sporulosa TaxID=1460663 RepID=A0A177CFZ2_9PLEO|nr:uncharacterized protein CC84DRAFT_1164787 [Paraphaeosphaeria sporulosa]OAG06534.1 hypothetical protein CC84DRAFT_1164787 [Paraphaeosphaeria sporulosa]
MPMTESCDVVRRKIRTFLDSGEMKVGEFQDAINVTGNAYSRFMGQNGPYKGMGSSVYDAAWVFFKKREMKGIKMPKKTAASMGGASSSSVPSVESIVLDFEREEKVPIFDTCDDIRRKINAHLKLPGVTQASFLHNVGAQYHPARRVQSSQLSAFRSKKGPFAGNTSVMFYGAYVYFEKLRIKQNKPKGKKREEMERLHGPYGGIDHDRPRRSYLALAGSSVTEDQYGRVHISGPRESGVFPRR